MWHDIECEAVLFKTMPPAFMVLPCASGVQYLNGIRWG
jgi:hypothetical protein